ncbi:hypothetical protein ACOME3_007363 [Neoechinorhynchus agilis]
MEAVLRIAIRLTVPLVEALLWIVGNVFIPVIYLKNVVGLVRLITDNRAFSFAGKVVCNNQSAQYNVEIEIYHNATKPNVLNSSPSVFLPPETTYAANKAVKMQLYVFDPNGENVQCKHHPSIVKGKNDAYLRYTESVKFEKNCLLFLNPRPANTLLPLYMSIIETNKNNPSQIYSRLTLNALLKSANEKCSQRVKTTVELVPNHKSIRNNINYLMKIRAFHPCKEVHVAELLVNYVPQGGKLHDPTVRKESIERTMEFKIDENNCSSSAPICTYGVDDMFFPGNVVCTSIICEPGEGSLSELRKRKMIVGISIGLTLLLLLLLLLILLFCRKKKRIHEASSVGSGSSAETEDSEESEEPLLAATSVDMRPIAKPAAARTKVVTSSIFDDDDD